jgi:hypothetical protein
MNTKLKKKEVREFNNETHLDKDLNVLIKELKESDEREAIEREQRINKIFREVIVDGK